MSPRHNAGAIMIRTSVDQRERREQARTSGLDPDAIVDIRDVTGERYTSIWETDLVWLRDQLNQQIAERSGKAQPDGSFVAAMQGSGRSAFA